jgi:hypothetical protein
MKKEKYLPGCKAVFKAGLRQVSGPHLYDVFAEQADRVGHVRTKR